MDLKRYSTYLLYCISLGLLLGLGLWQLTRGLDKQQAERNLTTAQQAHAKAITSLHDLPTQLPEHYQNVTVHGYWLKSRAFLLDNQVHQHQLGYSVLQAFRLREDQRIILVNRGWIARNRDQLARLDQSLATGLVQLSGLLYRPEAGFTLGAAYTDLAAWPRVVQYFDPPALAAALAEPVADTLLVLNADAAAALIRIWQPSTLPALRHFGYAAQWWGLALTLLVFGVIWKRRG